MADPGQALDEHNLARLVAQALDDVAESRTGEESMGARYAATWVRALPTRTRLGRLLAALDLPRQLDDARQAERERIAAALRTLTTDGHHSTLIPRDEALTIVAGLNEEGGR